MTPRARALLRAARGRLLDATGRSSSALVLPVEWAEPLVGRWRAEHDEAARAGLPAHITILYPFLPVRALTDAVEAELRRIAAERKRFRCVLERVGRFPGVVYLAPEPEEPFVELTQAIWSRWPERPPYGGAYDTVVPHLTVAIGAEPPGLAETLSKSLPIEGELTELWLMERDRHGRWQRRADFPLVTGAGA